MRHIRRWAVACFVVAMAWQVPAGAQPAISIEDLSAFEGESQNFFGFDVVLSAASATPVKVDFTTVPGSATDPEDFTATSGTLTFNPGTKTQLIVVPVVGDTVIEPDELFTVVLSNPDGGSIADGTGQGTIRNDDFRQITIGDATAPEGGSVVFEVTLSEASGAPVTVEFQSSDTTAFAPGDYAAAAGTVVFAPGETTQTITVATVEDALFETDETFHVFLSNPSSDAEIADNFATGTIENDDVQPSVSIGDLEVEEDFTLARFTVTLSAPAGTTVTVDLTTADGTATAPADFFAVSKTVTFGPGVTSREESVQIREDNLFEGDETFFANLSNPNGVTIADGQGAGTIIDDDLPTVQINDATAFEEDGVIVFDLTLNKAIDREVTVDFSTADGTAVAGEDYVANSGTVTFTPSDFPHQTISVTILDDALLEASETIIVTLSNPNLVTIDDGEATGTIGNDDQPLADLSVTKTGPPSVEAGGSIEYVITVSNAGPQTAVNVNVRDVLPEGTTLVSATPSQGTCSGTTAVICTIPTLDVGASVTITLVVTAPPTAGSISNTATVSTASGVPEASSTASTIVVGAPAHVAGIPTLSEWALLLMLMGLAIAAATRLRA